MFTFSLAGTAGVQPGCVSSSDGFTSTINLKACAHYTKKASGSLPVSGSEMAPVILAPGKMDQIKFLLVRSLHRDPLIALVTSAQGTTQRVPFDDTISLHSSTNPVTALALVGTGVVEYLLVGD